MSADDETLYEILGVPPHATQDDIERAYRKGAMEHHPDRGGDAEEFKRMANAFEILSDPDRRHAYDTTGVADEQAKFEAARAIIKSMMLTSVEHLDVEKTDLVAHMHKAVNLKRLDSEKAIAKAQAAIQKRYRALARVSLKEDGSANLLAEALCDDIAGLEDSIQAKRDDIALGKLIDALLDGYTYRVDEETLGPFPTRSNYSFLRP